MMDSLLWTGRWLVLHIFRSILFYSSQLFHSHAINMYLMNQYGKDEFEGWYPKDAKARSLVDHRLLYDVGSLFQIVADTVVSGTFSENES